MSLGLTLDVLPTISVVIPCYREEAVISKTLSQLMEQTAWKKLDLEIVISDYDPEGTGLMESVLTNHHSPEDVRFILYRDVKYLRCPYKGVGVGRNYGIQHSRGQFIVNFDADSHYNRPDAIDRMVAPLRAGLAEYTMCDVVFDKDEIPKDRPDNVGFNLLVAAGRLSPFGLAATEVGLTMTRFAYEYVGGFTNISQFEGIDMTTKLAFSFTPTMRQWIPEVKVISSARRLQNASLAGGLLGALNYQNAFRGNDVVKVL